jgi:4-hydroxy-tetrahydrodipicolinate synthase
MMTVGDRGHSGAEPQQEAGRMPGEGLRAGVHVVTATPFLPDESLDEGSLRSLVDFCVDAGADGVLVLGVMGEADRLSDAERQRVIAGVLDHNAGRMQVTVGVTAGSTVVTRERAHDAVRRGADAVMVSPPPGSSAGMALRDHFRRVGDGLGAPVVVQDHPPSSGVKMPAEFIAGLLEHLPPGSAVKLEDPPTPLKIARLRHLAGAVPIFGGSGGVWLLPDLEAGADGAMTGVALPETLVRIVREHRAGNVATARRLFAEALPLMLFEGQPGIATGLRKEILRHRGAIRHATVRQPTPALDETTLAELERLITD